MRLERFPPDVLKGEGTAPLSIGAPACGAEKSLHKSAGRNRMQPGLPDGRGHRMPERLAERSGMPDGRGPRMLERLAERSDLLDGCGQRMPERPGLPGGRDTRSASPDRTRWPQLHTRTIMPQPMRRPASPAGCVVKSSRWLWIMTVLPMISRTMNRSV